MRFAHPELSQSQSSTGTSIASKRAAEATTGPAGSELGFLGRFEKRSRSRLAPAVEFSSLAQAVLLTPTPCFACEEICHEILFLGARRRSKAGILACFIATATFGERARSRDGCDIRPKEALRRYPYSAL